MDEGTREPFVARCSLGILRIRENVFPDASVRDAFDKIYENAISSLLTARTSSKRIKQLWTDHIAKISSGEIAQIDGQNIRILKSIDKEIALEVEAFLNAATRAIKNGTQTLANQRGVNFGFLFKKQPTFESGLASMQQSDPALADYLREARIWTEQLITTRNDLEHSVWSLPRISYLNKSGNVEATEPTVLQMTVTTFADYFFNRIACFFEEVTAHSLQRNMLTGTTLTETPLSSRVSKAPERFQITVSEGGHVPWRITPHLQLFDDV
jgi:hypothetical protein